MGEVPTRDSEYFVNSTTLTCGRRDLPTNDDSGTPVSTVQTWVHRDQSRITVPPDTSSPDPTDSLSVDVRKGKRDRKERELRYRVRTPKG